MKIVKGQYKFTCECEDCLDAEKPCSGDCDLGAMCKGCEDAQEEYEEALYEIKRAKGIL